MVRSAKQRRHGARNATRPARGKLPRSKSNTSAARKPARHLATRKNARGPAPKPVVIDVHAHVLVPEVVKRTYEQSH